MSKFYITKVLAKGSGKTDSSVELQPGLNLIQGRSNTGKTCIIKCIDFCFGSKNKPFDESLGYTTIAVFSLNCTFYFSVLKFRFRIYLSYSSVFFLPEQYQTFLLK